jgi:hypothetical protein
MLRDMFAATPANSDFPFDKFYRCNFHYSNFHYSNCHYCNFHFRNFRFSFAAFPENPRLVP